MSLIKLQILTRESSFKGENNNISGMSRLYIDKKGGVLCNGREWCTFSLDRFISWHTIKH